MFTVTPYKTQTVNELQNVRSFASTEWYFRAGKFTNQPPQSSDAICTVHLLSDTFTVICRSLSHQGETSSLRQLSCTTERHTTYSLSLSLSLCKRFDNLSLIHSLNL